MGTPDGQGVGTAAVAGFEQALAEQIAALAYLPTTAAVALKFVELGRDPDAEPADYARVISADSSLSSKLLSLANSSWAGVRSKVTKVKTAVNLLGLGTVRTLAISYCMAGLHNELRLTSEESQMFWETALWKAVAAKHYAATLDPKHADEAFAAGLFQDFALPLMYAVAREQYLELLRTPNLTNADLLDSERLLFGADHTAAGRQLANRLELPDVYAHIVGEHHDYENLSARVTTPEVRDASYVAGLLPHSLHGQCTADARTLLTFLQQHAPALDLTRFTQQMQAEYEQLYGFFVDGQAPTTSLDELLRSAAREIADNTVALVRSVRETTERAACVGREASQRVRAAEEAAGRDALTGLLTRSAFCTAAHLLLENAGHTGKPLCLVFFDLDQFKPINDLHGHEAGDRALQRAAAIIKEVLPANTVLGRYGGDEFLALLPGVEAAAARTAVTQVLTSLHDRPLEVRGARIRLAISAGVIVLTNAHNPPELDLLLRTADQLMYDAKHSGGNRYELRTL